MFKTMKHKKGLKTQQTIISKVLGYKIKRNKIELLDIKVALGVISKIVE